MVTDWELNRPKGKEQIFFALFQVLLSLNFLTSTNINFTVGFALDNLDERTGSLG